MKQVSGWLRGLIALTAAAMLAGCVPEPPKLGYDPLKVAVEIDKLDRRLDVARGLAGIMRPFLPPLVSAKVDAGIAAAEKALAVARAANGAAGGLAAIERARKATETVAGLVGAPPE